MRALTLSLPRAVPMRPLLHLLCALPLAWLAGRAGLGLLGANPVEAMIRFSGDWALRLLVIGLAFTPIRMISGWGGLMRYRRMVGLWAFAYVLLHLTGYVVLDQFFDWQAIGHEIVKHKFITAGMVSLTLLIPLALTSTNAMIKRLGGRTWRRLHQAVYLAVPLAAVHYIWMVKADIRQPLVYFLITLLLLSVRFLYARRK